MSIMQRITLIGFYNYNPNLFDDLILPEAYDKNTFIESLLIEHGEKLVLYSDYDFMKYSIGAWGRKWSMELTRIAEALMAEYNPIWNYDRYEEWKDSGGKRGSTETDSILDTTVTESAGHVGTTKTSNNLSTDEESSHALKNKPDYKETNVKENITNGETEHQVSADNESTYQPASKDITNVGKIQNTMTAEGDKDNISERNISKVTNSGSIDAEESARDHTENKTSGNNKEKMSNSEVNNSDHVGHIWGNVGVTTSASMVTEVVEQRMKYNLYNVACRLFANELLIGIY